ncbi:MAG: hypothetical protein ACR2OB_11540 [Solirubrobacteraceae bacterium]
MSRRLIMPEAGAHGSVRRGAALAETSGRNRLAVSVNGGYR